MQMQIEQTRSKEKYQDYIAKINLKIKQKKRELDAKKKSQNDLSGSISEI